MDKESLCVVAAQRVRLCFIILSKSSQNPTTYEKQVWHLRLTIHFLADAGNMLDCASLAAVAAFRHFRRPEVEVIGEDVVVVSRRCVIE